MKKTCRQTKSGIIKQTLKHISSIGQTLQRGEERTSDLEHQRNNRLSEILAVERLCKSIGYGNVMDIASGLWAIEEGVPMHVPTVEAYLTEDGKETARMALNARIEEIKELKHLLLF